MVLELSIGFMVQTFALECPITSPCSQVLRFLTSSRYLCLLCPQFTKFLLVATDFGSVRYTVGSEVKAIVWTSYRQ